jgi:hypothetical protein
MNTGIQANGTTRVLAMTCVGLLSIAAVQLAFPAKRPDTPIVAGAAAALPEMKLPPAYIPATFDSFTSILERPLLYADRKLPAPPPVVAVAEMPKEPLRLKLEGIALGGGSRIALLRDQSNNSLIHLAEGMTHNGWTLEIIESDKAAFSRDGEITELNLEVQTGRHR